MVGVLSSALTALVIGGFAGLASGGSPCPAHPPPPPIAVTPPPAVPPCEPAPTPAPPPPSPAVPRQPHVVTVPPPAATTGALGALTIICLPAKCVDIVDNGVSIGPGHIFNRPTPTGRHSLVLKSANATKTVNVEIVADQLKEVRMVMGE